MGHTSTAATLHVDSSHIYLPKTNPSGHDQANTFRPAAWNQSEAQVAQTLGTWIGTSNPVLLLCRRGKAFGSMYLLRSLLACQQTRGSSLPERIQQIQAWLHFNNILMRSHAFSARSGMTTYLAGCGAAVLCGGVTNEVRLNVAPKQQLQLSDGKKNNNCLKTSCVVFFFRKLLCGRG